MILTVYAMTLSYKWNKDSNYRYRLNIVMENANMYLFPQNSSAHNGLNRLVHNFTNS